MQDLSKSWFTVDWARLNYIGNCGRWYFSRVRLRRDKMFKNDIDFLGGGGKVMSYGEMTWWNGLGLREMIFYI